MLSISKKLSWLSFLAILAGCTIQAKQQSKKKEKSPFAVQDEKYEHDALEHSLLRKEQFEYALKKILKNNKHVARIVYNLNTELSGLIIQYSQALEPENLDTSFMLSFLSTKIYELLEERFSKNDPITPGILALVLLDFLDIQQDCEIIYFTTNKYEYYKEDNDHYYRCKHGIIRNKKRISSSKFKKMIKKADSITLGEKAKISQKKKEKSGFINFILKNPPAFFLLLFIAFVLGYVAKIFLTTEETIDPITTTGGLPNMGNTCYLNSVLQMLRSTLPGGKLQINGVEKDKQPAIKSLNNLFDEMDNKHVKNSSLKKVNYELVKIKTWKHTGRQEGAGEYIGMLLENLKITDFNYRYTYKKEIKRFPIPLPGEALKEITKKVGSGISSEDPQTILLLELINKKRRLTMKDLIDHHQSKETIKTSYYLFDLLQDCYKIKLDEDAKFKIKREIAIAWIFDKENSFYKAQEKVINRMPSSVIMKEGIKKKEEVKKKDIERANLLLGYNKKEREVLKKSLVNQKTGKIKCIDDFNYCMNAFDFLKQKNVNIELLKEEKVLKSILSQSHELKFIKDKNVETLKKNIFIDTSFDLNVRYRVKRNIDKILPEKKRMIIQLKRFKRINGNSKKIGTKIADAESITLNRKKFILVGVISHISNSTNSGHYVAYTKDKHTEGKWKKFDDTQVTIIETEKDIKEFISEGYLYFYKLDDSLPNN